MRLLFIVAVLFLGWSIATSLPTAAAPVPPQDTAVLLEFDNGWCSGTVVGPHTILTGTHCTATGTLVSINDKPARSTNVVNDGHDHALVTVTATFDKYATIRQRWLAQSETIHYIGNPALQRDLFRRGYVEGVCIVGDRCLSNLLLKMPEGIDIEGARATLLSTSGWAGDSGAGVFDAEGYLVTTVSAITEVSPTMHPMVTFDMQFTREQLEAIR